MEDFPWKKKRSAEGLFCSQRSSPALVLFSGGAGAAHPTFPLPHCPGTALDSALACASCPELEFPARFQPCSSNPAVQTWLCQRPWAPGARPELCSFFVTILGQAGLFCHRTLICHLMCAWHHCPGHSWTQPSNTHRTCTLSFSFPSARGLPWGGQKGCKKINSCCNSPWHPLCTGR